MIQSGLKKTADNFGGPAGLGKLAGLGTPIENSILGLQKFSARAEVSAADFQKTIDKNKDLATTTDAATKGLVDSSLQLQKFATEMDTLALTAMPGMTTAVNTMTKGLLASAVEMNKMVAMGPEAYAKEQLGGDPVDTMARVGDGAVNGALAGAAIGAFLGPIGAAIGAAVGGIGGGIVAGTTDGDMPDWMKIFSKKATGGPVDPNTAYTVGERGPEILQMGSLGGTVIPNDASALAGKMRGMVTPNAGPAGGSMAALGGVGNPIDQTISELSKLQSVGESAGGASSGNALAEAQINRLDQLITQMARSNSTNEEILQATRQ